MTRPQAPAFKADNEKLPYLLANRAELARAEHDGRYLHWEELRRRPVPEGVTREQWWQLIKLARSSLAKRLQLQDPTGAPFSFAVTDSVQRIVFGLEHELKGTGPLPPALRDRGMRRRYELSSLIEEALPSSQLEGASTTREVAKEMIRAQRAPRTDGERMVLSNYNAMQWVREHRDDRLTTASVLELHTIVMQDILEPEEGAGRFRRDNEKITVVDNSDQSVVHEPPPAASLDARMALMCRFANGTVDDEPFVPPLVRAILLHFWLAYDHPFVDGNGRVVRASLLVQRN